MARRTRDAFEVTLSPEKKKDLVDTLINGIEDAISARSALDEEAAYWLELYEQRRTRRASNMPWPDAADLTSWIGTEKTDALLARIHRTVVGVEPIWSVEGWGEAAQRAPVVEEFHQWKAEEERLQQILGRVLHLSLLEPMGVLEVHESTDTRRIRERKRVRVQLDPVTGGVMLDEDLTPMLERNPDSGDFVEAASEEEAAADVVVDTDTRVRNGPGYKVIPFRDFYVLPGHARDTDEVWGYGKRFYRRLQTLKERAKAGVYDRDAVESLPEHDERPSETEDTRTGITVTQRPGDLADKELWEVLALQDLDGKGARWYLATIHRTSRTLLRLQHDDLGRQRFVTFVPFPRPDSVYGYTVIEKLITIIEEHTAWRNAIADNAMMTLMAPVKRSHTALWDPDEVPWGPKAVIDVRDMNEVQPMQLPDLPGGALEREREVVQAGERLIGINDIAVGTQPPEQRTLGERQIVLEQSFVRMDQIIRNIQESLEDLFMIRHEIYKRALAENEQLGAMPSPRLTGLEHRGIMVPDGQITSAMLAGQFRGKPRGSVESADLNRKRADLNTFVTAIGAVMQVWPQLAQQIQTPQAARAILEEMIRVYRFENRQAFLGPAQLASMPGLPPAGGMEGLLGTLGGGLGAGPAAAAPVPPQGTAGDQPQGGLF